MNPEAVTLAPLVGIGLALLLLARGLDAQVPVPEPAGALGPAAVLALDAQAAGR